MKLTKRTLAFFLCFLVLSCGLFSAFAQTGEGTDDGLEDWITENVTVVNRPAHFAGETVTLYYNPVNEPENSKVFNAADLPESFVVDWSFPDENGTLWYALDTENWEIFADTNEPYSCVKAEDVVFDDATLFDRAMASTTLEELEAIMLGASEDEKNALTDEEWQQLEELAESLLPEILPAVTIDPEDNVPVKSEIVYVTVNFANVAPLADNAD